MNTFNPQGYNQANQFYGTGGSNPLIPIIGGANAAEYGGMASAANFANGLEGQREGLLTNLLNLQSVGGIQAQAARQANQINAQATNAGTQASSALKGMGYGSGAAGGVLGSSLSQGTNAVNASNAAFNNPQYISSVLKGAYGTIGEGMQNPLLQQAAGYEPLIMGQNEFNYQTRGQGLWGQLAPLLGSYLGGQGNGGGGGGFGGAGYGGGGGSIPIGAGPGYFAMGG